MDPRLRFRITHSHHPIAAPLSDEAVERLLARALRGRAGRLLDLGCGEGAWLLRALTADQGLRAVGVDLDDAALGRARERAEALGVSRRIGLHHRDVREHEAEQPFDVVLSVGTEHAFGGVVPTLEAVRGMLRPGGVAVLGVCFWERKPGAAALKALGVPEKEYTDLPGLVTRITEAGWAPVDAHVSSLAEWDAYEWSWTGSLTEWALEHPDHPDAAEALTTATEHRDGWLNGYRGTLGFVTLLLRATG
ncbi:SAM-dependent methyltransferase [Kitasatospora sp. NPDC051853]|uniref:SAM-dependent methyltransferase n=1 Tax=Kitasatospora sp. NPDC051853 TaxID=3364058 RepID=UPI0037A23BCE